MSLTLSSFAGSPANAWSGSPPYDGTGTGARFNRPQSACVDASGNVYVVDTDLQTIRKITSAGVVTTLAGSVGITGNANGTGSAATFNFGGGTASRGGIAVDAAGNVYVADTENHTIRKITIFGVVTTFAGSPGLPSLVNGTGSVARFNKPTSMAIDSSGNLYVSDRENGCIRKITSAGVVTTFVGTLAPGGGGGYLNGTGLGVYFSAAGLGLTIDTSGNLYVADTGNNCIRKVTSAGVVTTLAGAAPNPADTQQTSPIGAIDGAGSSARFNGPRGVAVDASGKIYVADTGNQTIRMVDSTSGATTTEAGIVWNDNGYTNGTGAVARFYKPHGVACRNNETISTTGKLYVADTWNHTIRLAVAGDSTPVTTPAISSSLTASGVVGTAFTYLITASNSPTSFGATNLPAGLSVNTSTGVISGTPTGGGGTTYVTISAMNSGGMGSAGVVVTISGPATVPAITSGLNPTGVVGQPFAYQISATGNPTSFNFNTGGLFGLSVNTSTGLITGTPSYGGQGYSVVYATNSVGTGQATILITIGIVPDAPSAPSFTNVTTAGFTLSWDEYPEAAEYYLQVSNSPTFDTYDASTLVVEDGYAANSATFTGLSLPSGIVPITLGTAYYARVGVAITSGESSSYSAASTAFTPPGTGTGLNILTFAGLSGNMWVSPASYDGTGSNARFKNPRGMCVDASGNVYVSDTENHTIRKITSAGVVTTLAGSPGQSGSANGQGATARFNAPRGICIDNATGDLYVADTENYIIRKITSAGLVTTLVGTAGVIGSANGTGAAASFNQPWGIAINSAGSRLYVADMLNHTIRRINISSLAVATFVGANGNSGSADGTGNVARFSNPHGITIDSSENLYVCDSFNSTIRKVTSAGVVTTLAGLAGVPGSDDGTGSSARFKYPLGITIDSAGKLYVADTTNILIRRVDSSTGDTITEAGQLGFSGTADGLGGTPTSIGVAQFYYPNALAVSPSGSSVEGGQTLYIADTNNHSIRSAKLPVGVTPIITSPTTASGAVGTAFSYQIVATNSPTAYNSLNGVPPGLTLNAGTGLISGTPTAAATSTITLSATNASGTGFLTLTITVAVAANSTLAAGVATKTTISADLRRAGYYQVVSFYDNVQDYIYFRTDKATPTVSGPPSPYGSVANLSINTNGCVPSTFYDIALDPITQPPAEMIRVIYSPGTPSVPGPGKQIKTTGGVLVATLAPNQTECTWLAGSMSFGTAKSGVVYEAFDTGTTNNPVLLKIYTVKTPSSVISYNGGGKYSSDVGQVSCFNISERSDGLGDAGGNLDLNSIYVEADAGPVDLTANVSTSTRLAGAVSGGKLLLDVEISSNTSLVATLGSGDSALAADVATGAATIVDGVDVEGWLVGTSVEADLRIASKLELVARPKSKTTIAATLTADLVVRSIVAGESIISVNVAGPTGIEADLALSRGRYAGTLIKSYVIPAQLNMSSSLRVNDDLFRVNPLKVETSTFTATSIKADLGYIRVELASMLSGSTLLAASVARLTLLGTSDPRQANIFEVGKASSGTIGGLGQRWVKRSDLQNNDLATSVEWVEGRPPQLD